MKKWDTYKLHKYADQQNNETNSWQINMIPTKYISSKVMTTFISKVMAPLQKKREATTVKSHRQNPRDGIELTKQRNTNHTSFSVITMQNIEQNNQDKYKKRYSVESTGMHGKKT